MHQSQSAGNGLTYELYLKIVDAIEKWPNSEDVSQTVSVFNVLELVAAHIFCGNLPPG